MFAAGPREGGEEEDGEEGEVGGAEGEDHQDDRVRPPAERVPGQEGLHRLPAVHPPGGTQHKHHRKFFFTLTPLFQRLSDFDDESGDPSQIDLVLKFLQKVILMAMMVITIVAIMMLRLEPILPGKFL